MSRIIVVTGGASGLGEAIVNRFASNGDFVVVADADELRGRQVADNLTAAGLPAEAETVDVTSEGEVAAMFDAIAERHGRLDALVFASAPAPPNVRDSIDETWEQVLDASLKGPFLCCKHGIPTIAGSGGGTVVLLGAAVEPGRPGYAEATANGALADLAQQAAIEHAADGVRVNVVSPPADDADLAARVATTVALLCASDADFVNGAVIPLA